MSHTLGSKAKRMPGPSCMSMRRVRGRFGNLCAALKRAKVRTLAVSTGRISVCGDMMLVIGNSVYGNGGGEGIP